MLDDFIARVAEFVDKLVDENNSVVWSDGSLASLAVFGVESDGANE